MITKFDINLLVSITCLVIFAMLLACRNKFSSDELFYLLLISNLLIFMSSLKEKFDEHFYPNYYEIIPNRHVGKHIKKRKCFLRSKEHNDYKEKIDERLDFERKMEEDDRKNTVFKHEIEKLVDMGNENLEYIANGENF